MLIKVVADIQHLPVILVLAVVALVVRVARQAALAMVVLAVMVMFQPLPVHALSMVPAVAAVSVRTAELERMLKTDSCRLLKALE